MKRSIAYLTAVIALTACTVQDTPVRSDGVAVLPFEASPKSEAAVHLADAIQGDVITALVARKVAPVLSRTSTNAYRGAAAPIPEIASALHVRCVVEGWVERRGDRVRATVQLLSGANGNVMASQTIDYTPDSTGQADIAARLTSFPLDQCTASTT